MTEDQRGYVDRHRRAVAEWLRREPETAPERIEDHLPATMMEPCFGRHRWCRAFEKLEMGRGCASEFATIARQRADTCGDCMFFRAELDLEKLRMERMEKERKALLQERSRRLQRVDDTLVAD